MKFHDTARFFGPSEKLCPELFAPPSKAAIVHCRDCRKVAVSGIRRFCARCAAKRKRASTRESLRAKRRLNVRKTENSPVRAEAVANAKSANGCGDTAGQVFLTKNETAGINSSTKRTTPSCEPQPSGSSSPVS